MRHKTVDLDGPVHYIDFGGKGTPLLMVHGLGGSALNWAAVGPELSKQYHAVAIDLAGFGQTPLFRRSATLGANANLVHTFAEQVLGEPVILMGNSMGGHIGILEAGWSPASRMPIWPATTRPRCVRWSSSTRRSPAYAPSGLRPGCLV